MSLSKERSVSAELTVAAAEQSRRQPKCTRCRHHGIIIPKKGHMKHCPFLQCDCWACYIITQRTRITAVQRNQKKNHPKSKEQRPGGHTGVTVVKEEVEGTSSAAAPGGGARPSATSGRVCLPADGASERAATNARSPLDLRSGAAAGREATAGLDYGKVPSASSEEQT
ncbi:doublesex- and mab-3-related transcription factor 1-like, partial [Plectropomus leopardus]|uniref:doublesex- and mab-3-related transcription factor 1-like n=1 Tax=Plectropomus leopardus TaxID=160734 RepID=UPI001C4AAC42